MADKVGFSQIHVEGKEETPRIRTSCLLKWKKTKLSIIFQFSINLRFVIVYRKKSIFKSKASCQMRLSSCILEWTKIMSEVPFLSIFRGGNYFHWFSKISKVLKINFKSNFNSFDKIKILSSFTPQNWPKYEKCSKTLCFGRQPILKILREINDLEGSKLCRL